MYKAIGQPYVSFFFFSKLLVLIFVKLSLTAVDFFKTVWHFKMKWLVVLSACCVALMEARVLKNFGRDSATTQKLQYVDNLLQLLIDEVTAKKSALEDPTIWPDDFANEYIKQGPLTFDYIVVGAGTAGSVVASRLSEDPDIKVLVLEAGDNPPIQSEMHPISLILLNTSHTWEDYAEPSPSCCKAMKNERCFWPRGRMIGGTGALNGNIFLAGHSKDFDEWQEQGNLGWSWNDVYRFYGKATQHVGTTDWPMGSLTLNHFQRLENYQILKDLMVNSTKELESSPTAQISKFYENILATVDRGIRMSTGKTYLAKVSHKRPNLFVIKNSVATKIQIKDGKAVAVEFLLRESEKLVALAKREIILSAGAFNSPKLLMLSGVGPQEHLQNLNIPVVKDLPVGQNLQDHGMMPLILKFTKNVPPAYSDLITTHHLYEYLMFQKGPLASSSTFIGFIKTLEDVATEMYDIMVVTHLSIPTKLSNPFAFFQFKEDFVQKFLQNVENETILEMEFLLLKPKSRGFVQLLSDDPLKGLRIHNNFASDNEDKQALLRFIRLVQKLQQTSTFKYYGLKLITVPVDECDALIYDTDDYWLCYIRYFFISAWHAAGTCRMGPVSDPNAVLDERLRVHGIQNLRVIDASIMPNITNGNTNGPTVMIGEKGAQLIKEDWYKMR